MFDSQNLPYVIGLVVAAFIFIPLLMSRLLRTVDAGTIRLVSWMGSDPRVYKGPGKSKEIPLFTTGTTIPSKAINIDIDVADQTADVDKSGQPRPIKVRVLASAIVSVGDSNEMVRTAANRFFAKPVDEQTSTLTDLLTSTGRRAINLLHHDELFNAKAPNRVEEVVSELPVRPSTGLAVTAEEDDRLAIIIKSACSRELQDLGLVFNSLNIKGVQSDVAEARRRQSAVEAKANADIVQADQERRAREAQLGAEQAVNDKQRELDQRKAQNAAVIADAEALKQKALQGLREAELQATQIAQSTADAQRLKIQAEAQAEAEAIRLRKTAAAQADAIRDINRAIAEGGDSYLVLKQLEMLPQIAPVIANALAQAKLVNISSDPNRGAAAGATDQITSVIQTVLAAQLVSGALKPDGASAPAASLVKSAGEPSATEPHPPVAPTPASVPPSAVKPPVLKPNGGQG
ncbi:MAG: flotillin family protein [Fimbriimonadaceae bacterium]